MRVVTRGVLLAAMGLALAAAAGGELLHVEMSDSALDFEGAAGLAYDAGSDGFMIDAAVTSLKVGEDQRALPAGTSLRIRLRVSGAGVAAGGAADQDLEISGALDLDGDGTAEYASPLLTGTFHGFGYENGAPDKFDFRFQTTGGSLAGVFGEMVGVALASRNSTFTGRFDASFGGDAAGTLGSVAGSPAGVMDLAAGGATTLAGDGGPAPLGAPGGVTAEDIYTATGIQGGLVVDVGCGNGQLTVDLHKGDQYLVHGIDTDAADVQTARDYIASQGVYGPVAADRFSGTSLPYVDNLVRLLVVQDMGALTMDEVMRVVAPEGVATIWNGSAWEMHTKPRPAGIDDWPQDLYDSTNNAVSHDVVMGPPRHMQWVGSPKWSRHHDRMASCSAMVEDAGRMFYIMDHGPISSIELPSQWELVARDAFNGTVLWKRQIRFWHSQLYPFKSGPAPLARRLVTDGLRVYATMGLDDPVTALDAIDGHTVRVYEETTATEEIILSNGVLFCLGRLPPTWRPQFIPVHRVVGTEKTRVEDEHGWDPSERDEWRNIVAVEAATGNHLWTSPNQLVMPLSLTADDDGVYFHDGTKVIRLDRTTGGQVWASAAVSRRATIATGFAPTLVAYGQYLLFAGGDQKMHSLQKSNGQILWTQTHLAGGHNSPQDLLIIDADPGTGLEPLAFSGRIANGSNDGLFEGRDLLGGTADIAFTPDISTYWFHHRCHRSKATQKYILPSRTGIEFVDPDLSEGSQRWQINHWIRSGCIYGCMPANGMLYTSPTNCACYLTAKMYGFTIVAPESPTRPWPVTVPDAGRLEEGPAYSAVITGSPSPGDWPTYRGNAVRTGYTATAVATSLAPRWRKTVGGNLSSLTAAEGRLYVCSVDKHRLFALDADSGDHVWSFTAGGRIDSPPTVEDGRVFFGSMDGYVYCLRADDGELVWRFRAAPYDLRMGAWEQVESVWPVHGSVLVQDGVVTCVAGRSFFLDGGIRFLCLDAETGAKISETVLDDKDPHTGEDFQVNVSILNMPTALPDILSGDGTYVYMREQALHPDGSRDPYPKPPLSPDAHVQQQVGDKIHLFCPTGFLDGTWMHRAYWVWGQAWSSGHGWYYKAGLNTPSGRILAIDDSHVFGYGRKPEYYKWTTPLEYQLFSADRPVATSNSYVEVANSTSLDPSGAALTVEAWVKPSQGDGVVLAHGGATQGYALFLESGTPRFVVRVSGTKYEVAASAAIPMGAWTHLAGVLRDGAPNPTIEIYVNGAPAGTPVAAGLIPSEPSNTMQVGQDQSSMVGTYTEPFGINATIDELCVYRRALAQGEIAAHYTTPGSIDTGDAALSLYFSFNAGNATDDSGHGNDGAVIGPLAVAGKAGQALAFANLGGGTSGITYAWTREIPLHVRAMTKAADVLFIAGPPDVVDEEYAFDHFMERRMQARLRQQVLALDGKLGGVLWAVSPDTGDTLAEYRLSVPPVWDGMIAVNGRLYVAMTDGTVVCYEPR
ncbi:MAG: PQQ-binding-like beta-propeller repeat protein [Planctomycetes bacterium]|nr:PQQ-binding-like beta-propeller repeat protein [Planctomycetota bacterium]